MKELRQGQDNINLKKKWILRSYPLKRLLQEILNVKPTKSYEAIEYRKKPLHKYNILAVL